MVKKIFQCLLVNVFICFIITYANFSIQQDILGTIMAKENCDWDCLEKSKGKEVIKEFDKEVYPINRYIVIIGVVYVSVITPFYFLFYLKDLFPREKFDYIIINDITFLLLIYIMYFRLFPQFIEYM